MFEYCIITKLFNMVWPKPFYAWPSDLVRTKNWGSEILTDADMEGQYDLIIAWVMASINSASGHDHSAVANKSPKITLTAAAGVTGILPVAQGGSGLSTGVNLIPSGLISLWSGAIAAIPTGWVICDGNNSTPDLTDRFVIHADADAAGTNNVGDTGGAKTHVLSTAEMPAHVHTETYRDNAAGGGQQPAQTGAVGGEAQYSSDSAGSGGAHTNRDLFYALAYIMKT